MSSPPYDNTPEEVLETQNTPSTASTNKVRKKTSEIWKHFSDHAELPYKVVCNYCGKVFSHALGGGLGHLKRHYEDKHMPKEGGQTDFRQARLQIGSSGNVGNWKFDEKYCRERTVQYIIEDEQAFSLSANPRFFDYVTSALQPQFKKFSRQTTQRIAKKKFLERKQELITEFNALLSKISLTSDIWTGPNDWPFICLTAHWIDIKWVLEKRIIAFKVFPYPHTGAAIANHIESICKEYKIQNKINSISFDNASNNNVAVTLLTRTLSIVEVDLFHCRCSCHIINLIVQDCLSQIRPYLNKVREAVGFIRASPKRLQQFNELCEENGLKLRKFKNDTPTRWNSTYELLRSCLPYHQLITIYYNSRANTVESMLNDVDWNNCKIIYEFLEPFYIATKVLSKVYEPTSHILLIQLFQIAKVLGKHRLEASFGPIIQVMDAKFKSYWEEPPMWCCLATIMDPRYRLGYTQALLDDIFENMNMSDKTLEFIQKVQDKLNSLFEEYNKYYGTSSSSASASSTTSSHPSKSIFKLLDKKRKDKYEKRGVSNELESYLSCELAFNQDEQDNLDILTWWSNNALRFPVVSRLAKDLLTIPASTVASESAFSAGKRILTDTRNRLSDANVEAAVCNKDWYDAVRRLQGLTLDDSSPEDDNSTTPTTDVD